MSHRGSRRSIVSLTVANMVDFGLQFLLPIMLVRLLDTAAFADYRLAWLAIGTAMAVAPFALPRSLFYFLPRTQLSERSPYVHQSFVLLVATGFCAGVLLAPWNPLIPDNLRHMTGAAWFLPAFLTLWVAASLIEFLPNAEGNVPSQARIIVLLAILRVVGVGLGALSGKVEVVFGCLLAYALVKFLFAYGYIGWNYGWKVWRVQRTSLGVQLAYVVPFGLSSALFLLRGQADQWVAAVLFSPASFAAFSIGIVVMPLVALIRNSVNNAITPRLSALESSSDQTGMLRLNQRANTATTFVLLPFLALVAVLADHLVTLVYTAKYAAAADVMRINVVALLGVAVEVSTLTIVLNQGRFLLKVDFLLLLVGIAAGYAGALLFGLPGAALGNVLTLGLGNAFSFWRVSRLTGVPISKLQQWTIIGRVAFASLMAAVAAWIVDRLDVFTPLFLEACLISGAFALVYFLMLQAVGGMRIARDILGRTPIVQSPPA